MNKFGKFALTMTSMAPILGAVSINNFAKGKYFYGCYWLLAGLALVWICLRLLARCRSLPQETMNTAKVKAADKEVLSFLVIYLLPIFTKDMISLGDWLTPAYVLAAIGACIYNSNAFTFNPVLSLLKYHFYEVEIEGGMSYLLITKESIRRNGNSLQVREISDYMYLQP